ncbi:MAG TPA: UMP kinase, partial [Rhizomicrobium sp.]|nr:UMP kinase [Rhizomicrobium sp.]
MSATPNYRRILLKVSGEALMGNGSFGVDIDVVDRIARDVKEAHSAGTQICMVVGGGNIFRGLAGSAKGIDRSTADYMGMLATVMNALALQAGMERVGLSCRVQ